jgi:hypothetical protein
LASILSYPLIDAGVSMLRFTIRDVLWLTVVVEVFVE